MRTSKREQILDAALAVVDGQGVSAVTFDSVSAASGISRGGLVYHFPSKDALLLALHEHLAQRWDAELVDALGAEPEAASEDERVAAYARASARSATGPELLLMLESQSNATYAEPWKRVMDRWLPAPATIDPNDPKALTRVIMRLAADGLWLTESLNQHELPPQLRAALANHIASLVAPDEGA